MFGKETPQQVKVLGAIYINTRISDTKLITENIPGFRNIVASVAF